MKYLNTFKESKIFGVSFNNPLRNYLIDDSNFPERENVINIFENITDWCYINGETSPQFNNELFVIDEWGVNSINNRFSLQSSRRNEPSKNPNLDRYFQSVYYKGFRITLVINPPKIKTDMISYSLPIQHESKIIKLDNLIKEACKRLENAGFYLPTKPPSILNFRHDTKQSAIIFINILDKNNPFQQNELPI